jgi:hypothetical protein
MARTPLRPDRRALGLSVLAAFLLLAGTAEERTFGSVSDEQQMLYSAISIATTGEIGIARGQTFSIPRPGGDAVSPYGMGQSLVEVPFALLAGPWESRFGARTSQSLFVLLEVLLVTLAAAGAGLLAAALGAEAFGQVLAVLGTAAGSPLWAYTGFGFSEPLQAACLVFAVLFATRAGREGGLREAVLAGFSAGFLVVAKGVNVAFVPLALAPLAFMPARERMRKWLAAAAGLVGPFTLFLVFEIVRFGRPFSSYGDQRFSHPFLDGLWRLTVGPNRGLALYFPLLLLALAGVVRLGRGLTTRGPAIAIGGLLAGFLALYSSWWAWDGSGGWGPRFLVPLVPLLAAAAACAATTRIARAAGVLLVLLGAGVNALGVFESEAASFFYLATTGFSRVSKSLYEEYPASYRPPVRAEGFWLPRNAVASADAAFSPLRLHVFLLGIRFSQDAQTRASRALAPPWLAACPEAVPRLPAASSSITTQTPLVLYLTGPFRWPHLFMSLSRPSGEVPGTYGTAWVAGLADQTMRNLDIGRPERAARLAEKLFAVSPSAYSAALRAESLRLSGRTDQYRAFLDSLPERVLAAPVLTLVQALAARDAGQDAAAAALLSEAARGIRTITLRQALTRPPSEWPRGLRAFLAEVPDAASRVPVVRN